MNNHDTSKVLNKEDIKYLNDYFMSSLNTGKMEEYDVHYNLHKIKKLAVPGNDANIVRCVSKLLKYSRNFLTDRHILEPQTGEPRVFFLEYYPESFAHIHQDNVSKNGTSLVTLIDKPAHTRGGDIIIENPVLVKSGNIKRVKSRENTPLLSIETLDQEIGDTSIYMSGLRHGVSKVTAGRRRVLVCWFGGSLTK